MQGQQYPQQQQAPQDFQQQAQQPTLESATTAVPPAAASPAVPAPAAAEIPHASIDEDAANWDHETASQPATAAAPPVNSAPPRVTTIERYVEMVPKWVWWFGLALPIALVALVWSMRRQARLGADRERLERHRRVLEVEQRNLKVASEELRHQATNDPLTGILNRRAFADELRKLLEHLSRFGRPLDLIVFDMDHFKQINDQQGHLAGDMALKLVAGIVQQHLDSDDLFGRFGGDEFLIGCADREPGVTAATADTIRLAVVAAANSATPPLTGLSLSMGIARATRESGYHLEDLFARADTALYAAKHGGRNRVVTASEDLLAPPAAETVTRQLA